MSTCRDCGKPTGRRFAEFCDAHRWRHRGKPVVYILTPERIAYLREHYKAGERGVSFRIAKVFGVPKWRVCRWAAGLGLTIANGRTEPNWTPAEDAFLEEHIGSRHPHWIAKRLTRSVTAVTVRAKRLSIGLRDSRDWYTAQRLADGFGVDPSTVSRWIERGWLTAARWGQAYPDGRPAAWRIEHADVRRFVRKYPTAFTLQKVEQTWFLDLAFGEIGTKAEAA